MDDVHRGAFGVVHDSAPPLTSDEVVALAEGTPIIVIWSGGNGPHRYVVAVDRWGRRYAWEPESGDRFRTYNPLIYLGQKRFDTRVWLDRS